MSGMSEVAWNLSFLRCGLGRASFLHGCLLFLAELTSCHTLFQQREGVESCAKRFFILIYPHCPAESSSGTDRGYSRP